MRFCFTSFTSPSFFIHCSTWCCFASMLLSRRSYRVAFAIAIAVCCTTFVSSFYEIVWFGSVADHVRPLYDACTVHTADVTDGELTRAGFTKLVQNLSGQSFVGPFARLPLKFKSLFHAHACMDGRNCIGDFATIAVSTKEARRLTCSSLASLISEATSNITYPSNETVSGRQPSCMMNDGAGMTCISE